MDLSTVVQAVRRKPAGARLLVLMDFDGTLVDLADDPDAVELRSSIRDLLRSLVLRPELTVGVISGRRLADVRRRVGLGQGVFYVGLHGFEIEGPGLRFLHDRAVETSPVIQQVARALVDPVRDLAGVRVENKELTVAVHVRGAAPAVRQRAERALREIAAPHLAGGGLRLLRGADVFEFLPDVAWTKGDAVLSIKAQVERCYEQPAWPIYLGDDVTDEDAFRAVAGAGGPTIVVGSGPSSALYRLPHPGLVERFLQELTLMSL
jgi:trehalose-phosphatase